MTLGKSEFLRKLMSLLVRRRGKRPRMFVYRERLLDSILMDKGRTQLEKKAPLLHLLLGMGTGALALLVVDKCIPKNVPY
jgi:hypothetical protein